MPHETAPLAAASLTSNPAGQVLPLPTTKTQKKEGETTAQGSPTANTPSSDVHTVFGTAWLSLPGA